MLYEYLKKRMEQFPDKTLCEGERCITYRELLEAPPALLKELKNRDKLAVLCQSPLNAARAVIACLKTGRIAVPLSAQYGQAHVDKLRKQLRLQFAITDDDGNLTVTCDKNIPGGHMEWEKMRGVAFILCTSGTSGKSKGAALTKEGITANLNGIESYFQINENDKILIARPLYHCAVLVGEFLTSLCSGLDIEFMNEFDPAGIIGRIKPGGVTVMGGTPTTFYHLCKAAGRLKETVPLRVAAVSGECMTQAAADIMLETMPDTDVYHVYGLTEAGPRVSALPPDQFREAPLSVGYPLPEVELRIEGGELFVKSPAVMKEYYCDSCLTETTLTGEWLHTGDGAAFDEKGRLVIKGRRDDMIIRAGMNIYPREIEDSIKKADQRITDVLAYGKQEGVTQKIHLKAVAAGLGKNDVMAVCREHLPIYAVPDSIELTDELPRNASGKIMRPKPDGSISAEREFKAVIKAQVFKQLKAGLTQRFGQPKETLQINHYYSSSHLDDRRKYGWYDLTVRVRHSISDADGPGSAEKLKFQIKRKLEDGDGWRVSEETERDLDHLPLSLTYLDGHTLHLSGSLTTRRLHFAAGKGLTVDLDENMYLGYRDFEAEVEFEAGCEEAAEALWRTLELPFLKAPPGKAERFFEIVEELREWDQLDMNFDEGGRS